MKKIKFMMLAFMAVCAMYLFTFCGKDNNEE